MPTVNLSKKEIDSLAGMISKCFVHTGGSSEAELKLFKKIQRAGKRITRSSAKEKGRNLQKKVCRDISETIDIPYDQSDDQCLIHSREMGQAGVDIILRGEAQTCFPFSIECKSAESLNLPAAKIQAETNRAVGTDWMIVYKKKEWTGPVMIMDWNKFVVMYSEMFC